MSDLKLGKKPYIEDPRTLKIRNYLAMLPTAPKLFGFGTLYKDWGMLGNDQYGNCVFAGADHETMILNKARKGINVPFSAKTALADYGAVTGFDPNIPGSDQGTYTIDAMKYRQKTGVIDNNDIRHKIYAYVSIDPKDFDLLVSATFVFGVVGMGFEFPDTAFDQFDNNQIWDVVSGASIEGGHYIPTVGSVDSPNKITAITWGKRQELTREFYEEYNDESWAMLSLEMIRSDGRGLHGFDLDTFEKDLAAIG